MGEPLSEPLTMITPAREQRYCLAGLTFSIPFPVLAPASRAPVDVVVREGAVPGALPGAPPTGPRFQAVPGRWLFTPGDGSRFLARDGREVLFDPGPAGSAPALSQHLRQHVLAAVLHQRGCLPLHASAVRFEGGAVVLMGESRSGKSTLAAWLHSLGAEVLADDICPVVWRPRPAVAGGSGYVKLTPDAISDLALHEAPQAILENEDRDRRLVLLADRPSGTVALKRIYLLARTAAEREPRLRTLQPPEAVESLLNHTYRWRYLLGEGRRARQFQDCLRLAAAVPLRELRFPEDSSRVADVAAAILEDTRP